jgi:hypothetical protein
MPRMDPRTRIDHAIDHRAPGQIIWTNCLTANAGHEPIGEPLRIRDAFIAHDRLRCCEQCRAFASADERAELVARRRAIEAHAMVGRELVGGTEL